MNQKKECAATKGDASREDAALLLRDDGDRELESSTEVKRS